MVPRRARFEKVFREDGEERTASVMRFASGGYGVGLVEHAGVLNVPPGTILNFEDPDGTALALLWDRA